MRQLKFKFWDKSKNEFVKNLMIKESGGVASSNPENYDILQFTGLLDKQGVEIYEGDIVKIGLNRSRFKDDIATIKYKKNYAAFRICSVDFECEDSESFPIQYRIEVIGNIHENADLLK